MSIKDDESFKFLLNRVQVSYKDFIEDHSKYEQNQKWIRQLTDYIDKYAEENHCRKQNS